MMNNFSWENEIDNDLAVAPGQVHIRVQQRNARQKVTTIQGLSPHLNFEKIKKALMKHLCCNAHIVEETSLGTVIQFQGDHRQEIAKFIIEEQLVSSAEMVQVHG